MTTEIDVTDSVWFSTNIDEEYNEHFYIHCVCGSRFEYPIEGYKSKERLLWDCPSCGARLYFVDTDVPGRNKIIQVIDD